MTSCLQIGQWIHAEKLHFKCNPSPLHCQALSVEGVGERVSSLEIVRVACLSALVEMNEDSVKVAVAVCQYALTTHLDSDSIRCIMSFTPPINRPIDYYFHSWMQSFEPLVHEQDSLRY